MTSEDVRRELRALLARSPLKQKEIAQAAELSQSTISKLLNGKMTLTLDYLFALCRGLRVDPSVVVGAPDDPGGVRLAQAFHALDARGRAMLLAAAEALLNNAALSPPQSAKRRKAAG